jgi:choline dehydrogenase-like flavoprotein
MSEPRDWPGEVRVFADYGRDFSDEADAVVVGSGPCGAVAAKELACAGHRVVLLEEGPPFTPADFELEGALSMSRLMREGGLRFTRGSTLPTMQAIGLGGGSLVNSAICLRAPEFVLEGWCREHDLSHTTRADLDPHYQAVEKELGVAPTPESVLGPRNLLFKRACDALGFASEPTPRNVRGCRGSGECLTGCRSRAKQSMDLTYVPAALRAGARVLTSVQVQEVLASGGRATGVAGRVVAPFVGRPGPHFRVRARAVVLAAGCLATPVLLRRSGDLANGSGQVGENLQFHPGISVMGVFPEPVDPVFGATQGYQSLHFLREGFKLETLWAPPGLLAVRIPGRGHPLKQNLLDLRHAAIWDAFASSHRSRGRVRPRRRGLDPALTWHFHPDDAAILVRATGVLGELFFAAGARKILPGVHGLPPELHSARELEQLQTGEIRARDLLPASTHAFGTTRMHRDPRRGVVDELGRAHDLAGLWIVDTGIFPRSPGVNPMLTGMALARRAALALAEEL